MADPPPAPSTTTPSTRVNPVLDRLAAYSWRLIVVGIVVLAVLWLLRQARIVFFPVVVALFLSRALSPVVGWLRNHGWRAGLAAITSMIGSLVLLGALVAAAVPSMAGEVDEIRPTLTTAVDDIEDWLVDDSPINFSRESIDRLRERAGPRLESLVSSADGEIADRATLVAEVIAGSFLAVILTFFMLRDGRRFTEWLTGLAPAAQQVRIRRSLDAAWSTLAGYLRGATLLGVAESIVIGLTLAISGGGLVAPVMLITFMGAYVPLVGAVVAGLVAVLVALVTGGTGAAIAVAIVALLVQQFDNDLLAPVVYGRALSLHPVVILLSVAAGGALFGIAGTLLAVPVVAVGVSVAKQYSNSRLEVAHTPPKE
ncbi:MAG: AI-2E family transporter [Ilumatobacteraceae bacterium]